MGALKQECLLCLCGFLVRGGGWDCNFGLKVMMSVAQELLGLCLKMPVLQCGGDGEMARAVQDTDTPLF